MVPMRNRFIARGLPPSAEPSGSSRCRLAQHQLTKSNGHDRSLGSTSADLFGLLRYGPDCGELIGGPPLPGKQQAAALLAVGAPRLPDGSRLLPRPRDAV